MRKRVLLGVAVALVIALCAPAAASAMTYDEAVDQLVADGYTVHVEETLNALGTDPLLGFRLAGTWAEHEASYFVRDELLAMGLSDVRLEGVPVDAWDFGGARVMVSKQLLASGGLWLDLDGVQLSLDPGPGALVGATKRKLDPTKLAGILLSHRHLDHSADANAMIEAMTTGGLEPRGALFAPHQALAEDPVVLLYLRPYLRRIVELVEGGEYEVAGLHFRTPIAHHHHGAETYGFVFDTSGGRLAYIPDTRYFNGLIDAYQADYLIMNVVLLEPRGIDHLSVPDVARLVTAIRPRQAIITHFGMSVWRAKPWEVAALLTEQTALPVKAARDGMRFEF